MTFYSRWVYVKRWWEGGIGYLSNWQTMSQRGRSLTHSCKPHLRKCLSIYETCGATVSSKIKVISLIKLPYSERLYFIKSLFVFLFHQKKGFEVNRSFQIIDIGLHCHSLSCDKGKILWATTLGGLDYCGKVHYRLCFQS